MSLCIACALDLPGDVSLCPHHYSSYAKDDWAKNNRRVCDLIHRRIEPPRLTAKEREDIGFWTALEVT